MVFCRDLFDGCINARDDIDQGFVRAESEVDVRVQHLQARYLSRNEKRVVTARFVRPPPLRVVGGVVVPDVFWHIAVIEGGDSDFWTDITLVLSR